MRRAAVAADPSLADFREGEEMFDVSFPKPAAEQFFRTFDITLFAVSKDEKQLVFAGNLGGKFNLWAMDLPRTYPYPLTSVDQDVGYVLIDPKRRFIIAGFDRDGDENFHIYALPPEGGNPLPLLEPKAREKFFAVHLSEDGERIYYHTSRGNPTYLNICRCDLAKGNADPCSSARMPRYICLPQVRRRPVSPG